MKRKSLLLALVSAAAAAIGGSAQAYTVAFENVPAPALPYNGSSEGGFTITPTSGFWAASLNGNPGVSIDAASSPAEIEITGGTFTFASFQFENNNSEFAGSYQVEGFLNGNSLYGASGSLPGSSGWSTILSPDSATIIDALRIEVTLGRAVFIFIDNIVVNPATISVPDAGSSLVLLGLALAGLIFARSLLRIGRISAA
ncbi:MAG TPA: VPDSG-CTERM sorting domain-containing protein [Terrimicrobiaceae bacterium]